MKRKIVRLITIFAYWGGIDALFYWLNRRAKRVICFHHVMPKELFNEDTTVLSDTEESFRAKVRCIRRHWKISNDFNDARTVTLTFDDGYQNQVEIAGRVLEEEGHLPAVIFAALSVIGNAEPKKALVVDLLTHWNALVPNGEYAIGGERVTFATGNRLAIWIKHIRPLYTADGAHFGEQALATCDAIYPLEKIFLKLSPEYLRLRLGGITREQIAALREKGWLVGCHSVHHYVFSSLPTEEKKRELACDDAEMRKVPFGYPYGDVASIDSETMSLVEQAGYPAAFSDSPDASGVKSRYFLPRIALDGDFYRWNFQLSGLDVFLKTRRLLPVW